MPDADVLSTEFRDDVLIATLQPAVLDEPHTRQMKEELHSALAEHPDADLVVDLRNVKILPSLAIGVLVRTGTDLRRDNRNLILCEVQSAVRDILRVSKLDRVVKLEDTLEKAIEAAKGEV
jgi:anti-anti-sigma factor